MQEIRQLTSSATWRYVPDNQNPADFPSRGCSPLRLVESSWWKGPEWLKKPRDQWSHDAFHVEEQEVESELKKSAIKTNSLLNKNCWDAAVFEVIGIDLAGPLHLKYGSKAWICLFTCAIYRAVHLELLSSLSTVCFLESFRRFIARKGRPSIMFTDNGTNFVGAESPGYIS